MGRKQDFGGRVKDGNISSAGFSGVKILLQRFGDLGSHPAEIRLIPPLFKRSWARWGCSGIRGSTRWVLRSLRSSSAPAFALWVVWKMLSWVWL